MVHGHHTVLAVRHVVKEKDIEHGNVWKQGVIVLALQDLFKNAKSSHAQVRQRAFVSNLFTHWKV